MTSQQQKALHLWFRQVAEYLTDAGLDQRKVLKPTVSIPWTDKAFKENLVKPVMKAMFNYASTTELENKEVNQLTEFIAKHIAETQGITLPDFPSFERILMQQNLQNDDK